MKEELTVLYTTTIADSKGECHLECIMSDGSMWTCDMDGENWNKVKPSNLELSKKFNGK